MWMLCCQVLAQPYGHGLSQRHHTVFLVLALSDVQGLALEIDIRDLKVDHFLSTQPSRIDERQHDALFEQRRRCKQFFEFFPVEDDRQLDLTFE